MRHALRNLLIVAMFLSILAFVNSGSSQVSAASQGQNPTNNSSHSLYPPPLSPSGSHHPSHSHPQYNYGSYSQNYRQGYQDGYSDCQQQYSYSNPYGQGQGYSEGYDAGYKFCQSRLGQGQVKGYQDGYNDGYATCVQEHQQTYSIKKSSPYNQGYSQGYQDGFQQGYDDCEASYNTSSSYKNTHSNNGKISYPATSNHPSNSGKNGSK
jgi:hypothetical protein